MKHSRAVKELKLFDSSKKIQTNFNTQNRITTIKEEKISTTKNSTKSKNILRPKTGKKKLNPLQYSKANSKNKNKNKNKEKNNENEKQQIAKEYLNVLSIEKINFQFEEYGNYPDDAFQPSIFFFKFLANKPDYEKENSEKGKPPKARLKLYVPDTIVLNDLDTNY